MLRDEGYVNYRIVGWVAGVVDDELKSSIFPGPGTKDHLLCCPKELSGRTTKSL